MVEVSLTVGKLDASLALLLTKEHHLIEFPTILLPKDVQAGSIVKISCERDEQLEAQDSESFMNIQDQIMQTFGTVSPKVPTLRVRNVTETSAVLDWDPIEIATADIISLTLYKNGARFGIIPSPLTRTAIKLSGLAIDTTYTFYLLLATTAGTYRSEELTVQTHKMTDLTGITLCVGTIEGTDIDRADLEETIKNIGAKPLQDTVKLDTTHFVCTVGEGPQWQRALNMNIPVVRPEWIKACEAERRLVSVRAYYLNADPKLRPPVQRSRAPSHATDASTESTGHRRAVSEIADSPLKTPSGPLTQSTTPEPVPEGQEPEEEVQPRADIVRPKDEQQSNPDSNSAGEPEEPVVSRPEIPTLSVTQHDDPETVAEDSTEKEVAGSTGEPTEDPSEVPMTTEASLETPADKHTEEPTDDEPSTDHIEGSISTSVEESSKEKVHDSGEPIDEDTLKASEESEIAKAEVPNSVSGLAEPEKDVTLESSTLTTGVTDSDKEVANIEPVEQSLEKSADETEDGQATNASKEYKEAEAAEPEDSSTSTTASTKRVAPEELEDISL